MAPMDETGLFSLSGKTAVVIGGGGVLAGEMASGLARAGADIAIIGRTLEHAQKRADAIAALGRKAVAIQADGARKTDLQAALDTVLNTFGQVDILINGAGINSATPFFEI